MKKGWIIAIIGVILIIALAVIFYPRPQLIEKDEYNVTREEPITVASGWLNDLESCKGYSTFSSQEEMINAGYNQFCWDSTDIDDLNLSKLKALEDIKGIFVDNYSNYSFFPPCNLIWKLDYTHIGAKSYHRVLEVYECVDKFYLAAHTLGDYPPNEVYRINPSQEIIDILKDQKYMDILKEIQEGNEYGIANNVSDFCFPWRSYDRRCSYTQDKFYTLYYSYNLSNFSREQRINVCYEFAHKGSVADCLKKINESEECLKFANGDEYLVALCNLKSGVLPRSSEPGIPEEVKTYPTVRFSD